VKRVRVFKYRVLRKIFGPKRDEVTGEWRRVHNEELYAMYFSLNIIWVIQSRRLRWAGYVACMGDWTGAQDFDEDTEGKRPLGRWRCRQ
jgi:hypothetical protein